jgi:hypothetical protein
MNTKRYKHFSVCVALIMAIAIIMTQTIAFAKESRGQDLSLTIESTYDGQAIANQEYSLYEFGYLADDGTIVVNDDFKDYDFDFDNMTEDNWNDLAETASAYAQRDEIEPKCTGETDENGEIVFSESNSNLTDAIYLVVGESVDTGEERYSCKPFFISLPETEEDGEFVYDATANPKLFIEDIPETAEISVVKIWEDESNEDSRPDSINVQLLKDGKVYRTQTLSQDNNWRYTWRGLDSESVWTVVEETVPDGYTISLESDDSTFTLTNKFTETVPGEPTTSEEPTTPNTSTKETTTKQTVTTDKKLPKTGLNWLPVPILLFVGIILVFLGVMRRKNGESEI